MSELIERVAKVMAAVAIVENTGSDFDDALLNIGDYNIAPFRPAAHAAIEAMRELPEEPGPRYSAGEYSRRNHAAMIDDALRS